MNVFMESNFEKVEIDTSELNFKTPDDSLHVELDEDLKLSSDIDDKSEKNKLDEEDLIYKREDSEKELSVGEIIEATNNNRDHEGLSRLEESYSLNLAAEEKARDMLDREYFAHIAPTGEGAADLASNFDYSFILIGENLAKGNFQNSQDLVEGWMNSPDHRDNILREEYEEIGVGIKKGDYKDNKIWMAVQIFAVPSSSCPRPDSQILSRIEEIELEMQSLIGAIEEIDRDLHLYSGSRYNEQILERNKLAQNYNYLRTEIKNLVKEYNYQVERRNECVDNY